MDLKFRKNYDTVLRAVVSAKLSTNVDDFEAMAVVTVSPDENPSAILRGQS